MRWGARGCCGSSSGAYEPMSRSGTVPRRRRDVSHGCGVALHAIRQLFSWPLGYGPRVHSRKQVVRGVPIGGFRQGSAAGRSSGGAAQAGAGVGRRRGRRGSSSHPPKQATPFWVARRGPRR